MSYDFNQFLWINWPQFSGTSSKIDGKFFSNEGSNRFGSVSAQKNLIAHRIFFCCALRLSHMLIWQPDSHISSIYYSEELKNCCARSAHSLIGPETPSSIFNETSSVWKNKIISVSVKTLIDFSKPKFAWKRTAKIEGFLLMTTSRIFSTLTEPFSLYYPQCV